MPRPEENQELGASGPKTLVGEPLLVDADENIDSTKTFLERWSTLILCCAMFLLPLVSLGAVRSFKVSPTDIRQWLPSGFAEAITYDWFQNEFGVDEMVVVSWRGCELDDPRVTALREALEEQSNDEGPIFERVSSGPDMLAQIQSVGVSRQSALRRIRGLMVGRDGKTTAVVAYPVKGMTNRRREVVDRVYEVANREIGIAPEQLKAGGPTVDGAAIECRKQTVIEPVSLDVDRDRVSADLVSVAGPATHVFGHVLFCSLRSDCSVNPVLHGRTDESDHGYVADTDVHSGRFRLRPYR